MKTFLTKNEYKVCCSQKMLVLNQQINKEVFISKILQKNRGFQNINRSNLQLSSYAKHVSEREREDISGFCSLFRGRIIIITFLFILTLRCVKNKKCSFSSFEACRYQQSLLKKQKKWNSFDLRMGVKIFFDLF